MNKSDEWLRVISLCLWSLRSVLTRVGDQYEARKNGTSHTSPDTRKDIDTLLEHLQQYSIQSYTPGRDFNDDTAEARNLFENGAAYSDTPRAFKNFIPDTRQAFYKARPTPSQSMDAVESESESESESEDTGSFPEATEAHDGELAPEDLEDEDKDKDKDELTLEDLEDDDLFTESTITAIRVMAESLNLDG